MKIMIFNQLDLKRILKNKKNEGEAQLCMVNLLLARGMSRIPMICFMKLGHLKMSNRHLFVAYRLFAGNSGACSPQFRTPTSKFWLGGMRGAVEYVYIYIYIYIYIHTHTYIHEMTYIHIHHIHTCMHTSIHTLHQTHGIH